MGTRYVTAAALLAAAALSGACGKGHGASGGGTAGSSGARDAGTTPKPDAAAKDASDARDVGSNTSDALPPAVDAIIEHAPFEPWVLSCIGWSRAGCTKASACGITPDPSCASDDDVLGILCQRDQGSCLHPDPASFDNCRTKVETETCAAYCAPGQQFCFDFCFFDCLPNDVPDAMDTGDGAEDAAAQDAAAQDAAADAPDDAQPSP
jgi:hypothetical protein